MIVSPFLKLPPEIRILIYKRLVPDKIAKRNQNLQRSKRRYYELLGCYQSTSLVSHQIRPEFGPLFISRTKMYVPLKSMAIFCSRFFSEKIVARPKRVVILVAAGDLGESHGKGVMRDLRPVLMATACKQHLIVSFRADVPRAQIRIELEYLCNYLSQTVNGPRSHFLRTSDRTCSAESTYIKNASGTDTSFGTGGFLRFGGSQGGSTKMRELV